MFRNVEKAQQLNEKNNQISSESLDFFKKIQEINKSSIPATMFIYILNLILILDIVLFLKNLLILLNDLKSKKLLWFYIACFIKKENK